MNPGRIMMPNMAFAPMMRAQAIAPSGMGLFGRIGSGLRSFNWSGLLSGANKTLNVVNQTIPLIKQTKPMVNNVRSMLKLAKAFGNETTTQSNNKSNNIVKNSNGNNRYNNMNNNINEVKKNNDEFVNDSYPNFFI